MKNPNSEILDTVGELVGGISNHIHVPSILVRFNVLGLLARNSLQGGKEWQRLDFKAMCLTPHLIDPQHHIDKMLNIIWINIQFSQLCG